MAPAPMTKAAATGNLNTPRIKPPCVLIVPPSPSGLPAGEILGTVRASVTIVYSNFRECTEWARAGHVTVTPAFRHNTFRRLAVLHPVFQLRHHVELMGAWPASAMPHAGHQEDPVERAGDATPECLLHHVAILQRMVRRDAGIERAVIDDKLAAIAVEEAQVRVHGAQIGAHLLLELGYLLVGIEGFGGPAGGFVQSFDEAGFVHRLRLAGPRSEEHTSELQSLMRISYAVFC